MPVELVAPGALALGSTELERLEARLHRAVRRARRVRAGEVLATFTVALPRSVDPTAVVVASRIAGEPWFVFEQPDREGSALATLGCVAALESAGPDRFAAVAQRWRALARDVLADPPEGPRGSGPVAVGGFAFAPEGGAAPHWSHFAPASLHVPQVALARRGDEVRMTLAALVRPDDDPAALAARL